MNLKNPIIRKDCEGNDVYLILEQGRYVKNLLKCYAYIKVTKKFLFIKYDRLVPIYTFEPYSSAHKYCSSLIDTDYLTLENKQETFNKMFDSVIQQVNQSINRYKKRNNGINLINDLL